MLMGGKEMDLQKIYRFLSSAFNGGRSVTGRQVYKEPTIHVTSIGGVFVSAKEQLRTPEIRVIRDNAENIVESLKNSSAAK